MNFEVYSEYEDYAMRLSFYIFSINPDGSRDICTSIDSMEFSRYNENESIAPTFSINGHMSKPFLQAMANTLHEIGITAEGSPVFGVSSASTGNTS